MILAVAVVLTVAVGFLQEGRQSILRDFQTAQVKLAQQATGDLRAYLESFDRDTRLAAALAQRTRRQPTIDRQAQDQIIQAAFSAQVTVVEHYRTISLFGAPEATPIVAIDPTEDPVAVAPSLLSASADVAGKPWPMDERSSAGPSPSASVRSTFTPCRPATARWRWSARTPG